MNIDEALVAGAMEAAADACTRHVVCNEAITAAVEYALAQQPAAVDDAKDAARYRWLKENHNADLLAEDVIDEAMSNQCDIKWRGCIP